VLTHHAEALSENPERLQQLRQSLQDSLDRYRKAQEQLMGVLLEEPGNDSE
jgi:hypothetical protein